MYGRDPFLIASVLRLRCADEDEDEDEAPRKKRSAASALLLAASPLDEKDAELVWNEAGAGALGAVPTLNPNAVVAPPQV